MQWGVADHWSDPFERLLSNRGDCEDCAILKYAALLEAGIPKDHVNYLEQILPKRKSCCGRNSRRWSVADP
jgi:hypothetical protein